MKLVEGIILIVLCGVVIVVLKKVEEIDDVVEVMCVIFKGVKCVFVKILDMLFVFKEVGVVDFGG